MKKIYGLLILAVVVFCSMRSGGQRINNIVADGVMVIPPCTNCRVTPFVYEGKIGFARNSSSMFVIIDPIYDDLYNDYQSLCDGMFNVKKGGKWGAWDTNAELFPVHGEIPCIYDSISPWRENSKGILCAKVTKNGVSFYINRKGERL